MEQLARTFKALADPTRLRIVNVLLRKPGCVCELQRVLGLPQPLLSRHLACLRNAGLVADIRQGKRVRYVLRAEGPAVPELRRFLGRVFQQQEELRREADAWGAAHEAAECRRENEGHHKAA
jgi:ArsR family transcriptional regulator, arsenate/arsenite/antimonite-responsive transcriptional repressor